MKHLPIAKVAIDSSGDLFVFPQAADQSAYEYIYREANGLRWDRQRRAFHAYEPSRWEHGELLQHIAATLRRSFNEDLCFTEETTWVGVLPELQDELRKALGQGFS